MPTADDARKTWCTNFSNKIGEHGGDLGFTARRSSLCKPSARRSSRGSTRRRIRKRSYEASVAAAETGNAADFEGLRASVARAKTNAGYTAAIGADLGVVGGGGSFDPDSYEAELEKVEQSGPAVVTVKFGKAGGKIDGVNVYHRLQGETGWKFLARDTRSPYVDNTPLKVAGTPEIREYRIRGVVNDGEIGAYSDTVQVTVA